MSEYHQDNVPTGSTGTGSIGTGSIGILPVHSPFTNKLNRQDACSPSEAPPALPNRQDACSPSAACSPNASKFMRPYENIDIHARNLPHWHQDNVLVFVLWRLADSLPQAKLHEIEATQKAFLNGHPEPWDEATLRLYRKNVSVEMEAFLDSGCGACVMKDEPIRQGVESALRFFDGNRYHLHAFVVMPNHVHVLFEVFPDDPQNKVLHSWKSFTAKVINKMLGRQGHLWQDESWDRLIRNETHYRNCVEYIRNNNPRIACIISDTENTGSTGILPVHSNTGSTSTGSIDTGSIGILPVHSQNRQDACSPSGTQPPVGDAQ